MKTLSKIIVLILCSLSIVACSDSETKSEEEVFLSKLTADTWILSNAVVDNKSVTGAFDALALTFTKSTISAVNAVPPIWQNASFEIEKSGDVFIILRSDGINVTVKELTASKLLLELQFSAGSKVTSVSGKYTFEFRIP
jgi:hypothetical protein